MNIGFIGLGNMGSAIAGRLLEAGHTLRAWNRSPEPARRLAERGAQIAASAEEAFRGDVVFSMLSDDQAIRSLLIDSGVLARASAGATRIHVNLATISAALGDELAERHRERGIGYVAAPVLGRPDVAAAGKLTVLVAGPRQTVQEVQPLLDGTVGQKVWRCGERASQANVVKLAVNFMLAAAIESMGEAAALTSAYGVEPRELFDFIGQSLFPGPVYQGYGRLIADGRFEPAGFKARLGLKDVRLALAAAEAATTPMPVASLIRDSMLEALARGEGEKEFGVVLGRAAMRRAGK
ncbi:MAG TPA: NAD(P)-dependent oxidoreductase [Steroidobacteraceae bacterium]|jgi:3-hydroxyisobutyrate dehydrogenase-like beta-hydroxyacid dehydrogenase